MQSLLRALDKPIQEQSTDANSITFLTCHKSKGLEWPVVIPIGLSCPIHEASPVYPQILRDGLGGTARIHFNKLTVDSDFLELARRKKAEEYQRLLYVTLTRSKNSLVLPMSDPLDLPSGSVAKKQQSFLELIRWREMTKARSVLCPYTRSRRQRFKRRSLLHRRHPQKTCILAPAVIPQGPKRTLPSSLSDHSAVDSETIVPLPSAQNVTPEDAISGGTEYGNWWHQMIQHFPWTQGGDAAIEVLSDEDSSKSGKSF